MKFCTIALIGTAAAIKIRQEEDTATHAETEGDNIGLEDVFGAMWESWDPEMDGLDKDQATKVLDGVADLAGWDQAAKDEMHGEIDGHWAEMGEDFKGGPEDLWDGVKALHGIPEDVPITDAPMMLFELLDKNGDGVDMDEAMAGVEALNLPFTAEDVEAFGTQLDGAGDQDGRVDPKELGQWLHDEYSEMASQYSEWSDECSHCDDMESMFSDAESEFSDKLSEGHWDENEEGEWEMDMGDVMGGLWDGMDHDGSGKLNKKEAKRFFKGILKLEGKKGDEKKEALGGFDDWWAENGEDEICHETVAEGLGAYFEMDGPVTEEDVIYGLFEAARGDDDKVDFDEARSTLDTLGIQMGDEDIEAFGTMLDTDGDAAVSADELAAWMA